MTNPSTYKKLLSSGIIVFLGTVVNLGASFGTKLLMARFLGRADFGVITLSHAILTTTLTIGLLGIHTGVARYIPRYQEDTSVKRIVTSAFQMVLLVSVALGILITVKNDLLASFFNEPELAPVIAVFGLLVPIGAIVRLSDGTLRGFQSTVPRVMVVNFTLPLVRFGVVGFVFLFGLGISGVVGAYVLSYVAAALLGIYYISRRVNVSRLNQSSGMYRELLGFSLPLLVTATMSLVLQRFDTFMIGYFSTTGDVGVYTAVYPLASFLLVFLSSLSFLFMPVFSELDANERGEKMRRVYQVVTKWATMAAIPAFTAFLLFPESIIVKTFGSEYVAGSVALSILSVAFLSRIVAGPNRAALISLGQTRLVAIDDALTATLNVALNFVLIPRYSFVGAAIATAASYTLLNGLLSYQLYRATAIHPFTPPFVRISVTTVGLLVVSYILKSQTASSVVLFVVFLAIGITYLLVSIRYGIESEEVALLLDVEDRVDVDLSRLKRLGRRLMK